MSPVWDMWDRDQWGRLVPGHCARYMPSVPTEQTINRAYVTEDQTFYYATEDGTFIYVPEP